MKIAIDLDHTITANSQSIEFFKVLTHLLLPEHKICILTNRKLNSEQEIAQELDCYDIDYSEIVITEKKADYIRDNDITIFFENEDESFLDLSLDDTLVFKIREAGNWENGKWVGSKKTTKMID